MIQKELATVLMHTADCRKDVFDKLVEKILPPTRVNSQTRRRGTSSDGS